MFGKRHSKWPPGGAVAACTCASGVFATGLPSGYDLALVHGAKAEGYKLTNVPLWQQFEDDFSAAAASLQRNYLSQLRETGQQIGAYVPGGG